jgi:hypothetical protein
MGPDKVIEIVGMDEGYFPDEHTAVCRAVSAKAHA